MGNHASCIYVFMHVKVYCLAIMLQDLVFCLQAPRSRNNAAHTGQVTAPAQDLLEAVCTW